MKFAVTAVAISRATRRRMGKARTEIVDTDGDPRFQGCVTPLQVEETYENSWNKITDTLDLVKVVDVRRVDE